MTKTGRRPVLAHLVVVCHHTPDLPQAGLGPHMLGQHIQRHPPLHVLPALGLVRQISRCGHAAVRLGTVHLGVHRTRGRGMAQQAGHLLGNLHCPTLLLLLPPVMSLRLMIHSDTYGPVLAASWISFCDAWLDLLMVICCCRIVSLPSPRCCEMKISCIGYLVKDSVGFAVDSSKIGARSLAVVSLLKHTNFTYEQGVYATCVRLQAVHQTRHHHNLIISQCWPCAAENARHQATTHSKAKHSSRAVVTVCQAASTGDSRGYKVPGVDVMMPLCHTARVSASRKSCTHSRNGSMPPSRAAQHRLQGSQPGWHLIKAAAFAGSASRAASHWWRIEFPSQPTHKHTLMQPAYARTHKPQHTDRRPQPASHTAKPFRQTLISPSAGCIAAAPPKTTPKESKPAANPCTAAPRGHTAAHTPAHTHTLTCGTHMLWRE